MAILAAPTHPDHAPADAGTTDLPSLPRGWRHAGAIRWFATQERRRRETVLALAFGVLSAVWAPLGILAFLGRSFTLFLAVSAVLVVLALAPRPAAVGVAVAGLDERFGPQVRDARAQLVEAFAHVRAEAPGVLAELEAEAAPHVAAARRRVRRGALTARDRLHQLVSATDQSTPSSVR